MDKLVDGSGLDLLDSGTNNDLLFGEGGGGNDVLNGSAGADYLAGSSGMQSPSVCMNHKAANNRN